jgi:hypothetical protein
MARDDRRHAPDREARMTPLERHARWLLRCYPAVYRRERSEEMIGTLLEATPDGRRWPRARDVRALLICGLKARAAQNRQRTVGANLRAAVMAGLALYLSLWVGVFVAGAVQQLTSKSPHYVGLTSWPAAVIALLSVATIVLAWTAPRRIVVAAALAGSAAVVSIGLATSGLLGTPFLQALALGGLAALAPRAGHPSLRWLWLPGIFAVSWALLQLGVSYAWFGYTWGLFTPGLLLLVVVAGGVAWVAVDARLIVAVLTYLAVAALQIPVAEVVPDGFGVFAALPAFGVVIAILAPAVWLLRRQSAHTVR